MAQATKRHNEKIGFRSAIELLGININEYEKIMASLQLVYTLIENSDFSQNQLSCMSSFLNDLKRLVEEKKRGEKE